ncbi:uncharacterized protein LOC127882067 [Dreissena polymorpha]|uniref:ADP-ribosylation factor n=1 Tax=Dreissena polymorpha TaxID=45954 RepID=A0A9D4GSD3_DREPO|nr:uncharacterized protein LOC127831868 isoform X2 [Dreissena polymorpha]XP_052286444.1 uncharacterized protein LOC127882067 [Dreissena polymorpha]XP_052286445.1 uncharacterized protein LOC127882067 [Dreissena polymorpha]KAH3822489.1 hypothetical protein DPMN_124268 [Dreissena polymorpha]KAH3822605.1 hypothetical protein DPMN_124389 [Dreissena polymorpha]
MGNIWARVFRHREVRVLMLGLDGAGKTTLLYRLKLGEVITHVPTIGFNVEQLQYRNITFTAWDIGARDKMRPLFRHYYKGTDAVVIVIDAADKERVEELFCDVLKPALHAEELAHSVFLFLVNKRDLPDTMTSEEVASRLSLKFMKHKWHILETSALRGDGLTESMEWLAAELGPTSGHPHRKHSIKNSPQQTAHTNDAKHCVTNDVSYCDRNNPPPTRSTYGQVLSNRKHTAKCSPVHNTSDTNGDVRNDVMSCSVVSKEISPTRDYCNRAYSAFRCFFIRPSVPPEVDDDDSD